MIVSHRQSHGAIFFGEILGINSNNFSRSTWFLHSLFLLRDLLRAFWNMFLHPWFVLHPWMLVFLGFNFFVEAEVMLGTDTEDEAIMKDLVALMKGDSQFLWKRFFVKKFHRLKMGLDFCLVGPCGSFLWKKTCWRKFEKTGKILVRIQVYIKFPLVYLYWEFSMEDFLGWGLNPISRGWGRGSPKFPQSRRNQGLDMRTFGRWLPQST